MSKITLTAEELQNIIKNAVAQALQQEKPKTKKTDKQDKPKKEREKLTAKTIEAEARKAFQWHLENANEKGMYRPTWAITKKLYSLKERALKDGLKVEVLETEQFGNLTQPVLVRIAETVIGLRKSEDDNKYRLVFEQVKKTGRKAVGKGKKQEAPASVDTKPIEVATKIRERYEQAYLDKVGKDFILGMKDMSKLYAELKDKSTDSVKSFLQERSEFVAQEKAHGTLTLYDKGTIVALKTIAQVYKLDVKIA